MIEKDPNEGSTDPMVPEYWLLGESVQDRIISEGYEHEGVDGIAVDIHDLLQAADRIKEEIAQKLIEAKTKEDLKAALEDLQKEYAHIAWHCQSADRYLQSVLGSAAAMPQL